MSTDFTVQAGVPFARRVRIVDGKDTWGTIGDCEARMQIRRQARETSALVYDFTPHLELSYGSGDEANDICIDWNLTGAETRALVGGYYDLIVSDTGTTDSRAIRPIYGQIKVEAAVTSAEDEA